MSPFPLTTCCIGIYGHNSLGYMVRFNLANLSDSLYTICLFNPNPGSKSKLKEGLPQECQIACLCALSGFQVVCDDMQKRSISVTDLQKIKDNHEQMKRLCEAATAHGDSKESGQLSYKAVNSALSQIMEEFKEFEEHQSHLSHLCSNIPDVVQGKLVIKSIYISVQCA